MNLLGTGLFIANSTWQPPAENAAPSITSVTLNFDFTANAAPVGQNQSFTFDVLPNNSAPDGQNQQFIFDVLAS